jgi:hypothetical protein
LMSGQAFETPCSVWFFHPVGQAWRRRQRAGLFKNRKFQRSSVIDQANLLPT